MTLRSAPPPKPMACGSPPSRDDKPKAPRANGPDQRPTSILPAGQTGRAGEPMIRIPNGRTGGHRLMPQSLLFEALGITDQTDQEWFRKCYFGAVVGSRDPELLVQKAARRIKDPKKLEALNRLLNPES